MGQSHRLVWSEIAILVHKALPELNGSIDSINYVGDIWTVRIGEEYKGKLYYRIADGIGDRLVYVTPRMLSNPSPVGSGQSEDSNAIVYIPDPLDWLFEGRDA